MTAAARDIAATIRMLTELAVRESRALKRRSFKEIAEGKHDEIPEQAFYMMGTIDEVLERAAEMAKA